MYFFVENEIGGKAADKMLAKLTMENFSSCTALALKTCAWGPSCNGPIFNVLLFSITKYSHN